TVNLLFGDAVPSGKTPVTFLRTVGQAPMYYSHNNTGRPYNGELLLDQIPLEAGQTSLGNTSYYLDYGPAPLFPFGYGLSYTTFSYSEVSLDKKVYSAEDTVRATFTLSNTGKYNGVEIAQLYVRDLVGSVTRPVKELKYFERIALDAGESREITFELPVGELAFWNMDMEKVVEPGAFRLWIAGDSASGEAAEFSVE
ncbi:MAG: fibronectin type III-like domain-contianing protein, partial [Bacteroidales bacterium]|nr:fibronectin type III-like domain-contianing protein [Bacteroidales bacterium]